MVVADVLPSTTSSLASSSMVTRVSSPFGLICPVELLQGIFGVMTLLTTLVSFIWMMIFLGGASWSARILFWVALWTMQLSALCGIQRLDELLSNTPQSSPNRSWCIRLGGIIMLGINLNLGTIGFFFCGVIVVEVCGSTVEYLSMNMTDVSRFMIFAIMGSTVWPLLLGGSLAIYFGSLALVAMRMTATTTS